jgi:hypothetical protein
MSSAAGIAVKTNKVEPDYSQSVGTHRPHSVVDALSTHGVLLVQCVALLLAYIAARECHPVVTYTAPDAPLLPSLIYGLVLWYWWGIAATVIWKLAERSGKDFFATASAIKHALLGVIFAGAHPWMLQETVNWLMSRWPVLRSAGYGSLDYLNWNRFLFELLLYGFIFGMTGVIHLRMSSQREAMRALSLEKQLSVAHLRALQMQIEPHFLFNTLNAIASLVESDRNNEAMQTLQHLNFILRSTLRRDMPEKLRLAQELELVDNYLSIEEVRFADRIRIDMTINPATLDGRVPCFLLQPMLENAIRHGISQCEEGGVIQVNADLRGRRLHLVVRNSGPDLYVRSKPGHGIGLRNVQERLAHFYGGDFHFRAGTLDSGEFEVFIDIPYEREAR